MPADYNIDYYKVTFPQQYVALVEINRPEKLNAFFEQMWLNLRTVFERLSHDEDVRVVILTGAGDRAFTSGLDVAAAANGPITKATYPDAARRANALRRHIQEFQACITAIEQCEKPVICALHGVSYGLALDIALACDIRLSARATTRFCVKEVDIGLAADIGSLQRLPHANVSMSWIKDVAFTARVFDSDEALRVGLVSAVYTDRKELIEGAVDKAVLIAGKSPVAILGTKENLNYSREHGVADGLAYIAAWNAGYLQTKDMEDAMAAGMQKKQAKFAKL